MSPQKDDPAMDSDQTQSRQSFSPGSTLASSTPDTSASKAPSISQHDSEDIDPETAAAEVETVARNMTKAMNTGDWAWFASFFAPWYQSEWVYSQKRPLPRDEMISMWRDTWKKEPGKRCRDLEVTVIPDPEGSGRVDVMKNVEYYGYANGVARRTFSIYRFYRYQGEWLCVRTQGANGCDLIPFFDETAPSTQSAEAETLAKVEEVVRTMTAAFNARDWDLFTSTISPSLRMEWDRRPGQPFTRDEIVTKYKRDCELHPNLRTEDLDLKASVASYRADGTGRIATVDVFHNVEYTGREDGIRVRSFRALTYRCIGGKWLCVKTQTAQGCDPDDLPRRRP